MSITLLLVGALCGVVYCGDPLIASDENGNLFIDTTENATVFVNGVDISQRLSQLSSLSNASDSLVQKVQDHSSKLDLLATKVANCSSEVSSMQDMIDTLCRGVNFRQVLVLFCE